MHRRRCRWHMLCNGRTAVVMYLARPDTLFVSDVIRYDAGERSEALTIVLALLALVIIPIDHRPTCTFGNDALKFHPKITRAAQWDGAASTEPEPPSPRTHSPSPISSPERA